MANVHRLCALALTISLLTPVAAAQPNLRQFNTKYYIIHSDIDERLVQEAILRITSMAETYGTRMQGFTGRISEKLPFYIFKSRDDYYAAGGIPGSAGVFRRDRLMAYLGAPVVQETWQIIQHEGFHQFARSVITGDIPVWVNEGMAEYFATAVFTGDSYVTGVIPQAFLSRVRRLIEQGNTKSFREMMQLRGAAWNQEMARSNYDQAWSMVHFLVHGRNGQFRLHFEGFLRDVGIKGLAWEKAWLNHFGRGMDDFERLWREYWLGLPDHPTEELYLEAAALTLTRVLGAAVAAGEKFASVNEFFSKASQADSATQRACPMPISVVTHALDRARRSGKWRITPRTQRPTGLSCKTDRGRTTVGSFTRRGKRLGRVTVRSR